MALGLQEPAILAENQSSIPSTKIACSCSSKGSDILFWSCWMDTCPHVHIPRRYTDRHKIWGWDRILGFAKNFNH